MKIPNIVGILAEDTESKCIPIQEIFLSINGETSTSGIPTIFIRTFGCNLKCTYCDTIQKKDDFKNMSINEIVDEVLSYSVGYNHLPKICVTGGEPMNKKHIFDLLEALDRLEYDVQVETNGSIELHRIEGARNHYKYIMDIKCPSSGVDEANRYINLCNLESWDEVKFVIADKKDFDFAMSVLTQFPTKASILLSPMFDENNKCHIGKDLVDWALDFPILKLYKWRVQVQIHKIIGGVK